jgi:hypothetical protein
VLYIGDRDHSLALSGDSDRSCSMFGRDFVVGGEDAADGGDAAGSAPSRAASALRMLSAFSVHEEADLKPYLKAFVLDSSFLSFSFTGGVPVRLLPALSSR